MRNTVAMICEHRSSNIGFNGRGEHEYIERRRRAFAQDGRHALSSFMNLP